MNDRKMPIGYWIRQADQLLTKGIDKIQSEFGLTRYDWQILNSLSERSLIGKKELLSILQPFLDVSSAEKSIEQLEDKELINISDDVLILTVKGKRQHNHSLELQKAFRQTAMKDISEENYQITIQTLEKIVDNLKNLT